MSKSFNSNHRSESNAVSPAKPSVRSFMDVREYMKAVFEWRKIKDPSFSYSQWSVELGFQSRTYLRLIVTGLRQISENIVPNLIRGLKLHGSDAEYFIALAGISRAKTHSIREMHLTRLLRLRTAPGSRKEINDHYVFLASHLNPRILVLLGVESIKTSVSHLSYLLGSSEAVVAEALERLERLGLAQRKAADPALWETTTERFSVKDQLGNIAIQSYHRKSLEDAIRAIDLEPSTRNFHSMLLPLTPEDYQSLLEDYSSFKKMILEKYQRRASPGLRLYQFSTSVIPVSRPVLREPCLQDRVSADPTVDGSSSQENQYEVVSN